MKEFAIKVKPNQNSLDNLTDGLVSALPYSDSNYDYPDITGVKVDDGVVAEWFYDLISENQNSSELVAILMYTNQDFKFDEISELMLGIGMTEMKHYAKLSELVVKLGGIVTNNLKYKFINTGNNALEALQIAIKSEEDAINNYEVLFDKILKQNSTKTVKIVLKLIAKIIADEKLHLKLLIDKLNNLNDSNDE